MKKPSGVRLAQEEMTDRRSSQHWSNDVTKVAIDKIFLYTGRFSSLYKGRHNLLLVSAALFDNQYQISQPEAFVKYWRTMRRLLA